MRLSYEMLDDGGGVDGAKAVPTVILLHPVGLSSKFWPGFSEKTGRRFRCIAVDTAGHGLSPDSPRPGRLQDRVAETADLIQTLGYGPVIVLGVSFGGMIAMQLALARRDLVLALVLGACPPQMPAEARAALLDRGRTAETGGMAAVIETTIERWFSPDATGSPAADRVRRRLAANAPSNWAAAWEAVSEHDALPRLGRIDVPTLVVAGERDASVPLAAKQALARAIPGARLAVIPGAPHMLHLERTAEFLEIVDRFLAELKG